MPKSTQPNYKWWSENHHCHHRLGLHMCSSHELPMLIQTQEYYVKTSTNFAG